ncbi:MAG: nucleotidyltransferase family protein [Candidatus Ranarchaeia archaeon]
MRDQLIKQYQVHYVAIFGSYVTETYGLGSDVDLLVVHDDPNISFEKVLSLSLSVSTEIDWEIHLYNINDFLKGYQARNPFFLAMLETSLCLYQSIRMNEELA